MVCKANDWKPRGGNNFGDDQKVDDPEDQYLGYIEQVGSSRAKERMANAVVTTAAARWMLEDEV